MHLKNLIIMILLHFVSMYILMFSMINTSGNFINNLNFIYMAALMTAPMLIMESLMMSKMYENKGLVKLLTVAGLVLLVLSYLFIRDQTFIGNKEFVRSMIPHHSGAILMCREAKLEDQELIELCKSIIQSQQSEIDQMERILTRL